LTENPSEMSCIPTGPSVPDGSDALPLSAIGWDEQVEEAFTDVPRELSPGRIVRVERGHCVVALDDGEHLARPTVHVGVGDWVGVRRHLDDLSVQAIAPRWSQLTRRDSRGLLQFLATNIDLVIITAPADHLSCARVERETAAAWDSGAQPLVVVTKNDLAEPGIVEELRTRLVGVDVVTTSSVTREGLQQIAQALRPCRTAVLLGPSGAGKSTLINCLLGTERLATSHVREGDRRGRHTTTSRQLVAVPGGGVLIDTPGLRALSLSGGEGVAHAFPDIEQFAGECRFSDCDHQHEPGCAVLAAVDSGDLDPGRLANYRKLQKELAFEARKNDPLARAAEERIWKIRCKAGRQLRRHRGR